VPVYLDRRYLRADLKITTGLIEPHLMAGYSGGRKVICPGIAALETVKVWHGPKFLEHPKADCGILDGNPVHEENTHIALLAGCDFIVNVCIDGQRRITWVGAGDMEKAWMEGVRFVENVVRVPVPRPMDVVVTSAAGYPLDKTYYQTVKGMVGPLEILDQPGDLIIASACSEGMGSAEFIDAQRRLVQGGAERFLEEITRKRFADIDEWQTEMQLKPMRLGSIRLFSEGLDEAARQLTGVELIGSIEEAVAASVARSGDRRVAIIPEGPYVVPVYRPEAA
jgi:nickel-dependent lactate racemase